jgi:glutathione synthase/RimK-type ligase-like ATP-grasp enzyme
MAEIQRLLIIGYTERLSDDHDVLLRAGGEAGVEAHLVAPSRLTVLIEPGRTARVLLDGEVLSGAGMAVLPRGVNRAWPLIAQVCQILQADGGHIVPGIGAIEACADKVVSTRILAAAGVPVLPTAAVVAGDGVSAQSLALADAEIVTKPARGSKARGVERHLSVADAAASLHAGRTLIDKMVDHQVVQPLASAAGVDYRVIVAGDAVISITRRRAVGQSFLTNRGEVEFSDLTAAEVPDIAETGRSAAAALGLVFGGVDVIEHHGEPVVLEANAWPGLAPEVYGTRLAAALVAVALHN